MCVFGTRGGERLKNQTFTHLSHTEKKRKLRTILRSRTNDSLTENQIRRIMQCVAAGVQYEVNVFTDSFAFCEALTPDALRIFGETRSGRIHPGQLPAQKPAVAIVTQSSRTQTKTQAHTILIYVPPGLYARERRSHARQNQTQQHHP